MLISDKDECADGTSGCGSLEDCVNLVGSSRCDCKTGYSRDVLDDVCRGNHLTLLYMINHCHDTIKQPVADFFDKNLRLM